MTEEDPLLSVRQVARYFGSGIRTVTDLIQRGALPSLDAGSLVAKGELDVPLVRLSWAESLQRDSAGAGRRIPDPPEGVHPAVEVALDFHTALFEEDADAVERLSSGTSRQGMSPQELLRVWADELDLVLQHPNSGIGTAVYCLRPLEAVAARVFEDAPPVPRAFERPTPAMMLVALPLVQEQGEWKVDLPLFRKRDEWVHYLLEPLPQEDDDTSSSDGEPSSSEDDTSA